MGNFIALGDYDIIAYLMVGLAMFMVFDLVLGTGFLYRTNWNTGSVTGIVLLAYLGGHLISIPANWLFEVKLVSSCLKQPVVHLVPAAAGSAQQGSSTACSVITWLSPSHFTKPATNDVLARIAARSESAPPQAAATSDAERAARDDALFHEAFITAKRDANSYDRMMIFQRLYLLFRNMGFLAFSALVAVVIKHALTRFGVWHSDRHLIYYGVKPWMISFWGQFSMFLLLSLGLFDRFLFFYRLYALEVMSAYAYAWPVPDR